MARDLNKEAAKLKESWEADPRWSGISRNYKAEEVVRLQPSVRIDHSLARLGAERLWKLLQEKEAVRSLGAITGAQAVQMVRAGLKSIYMSGWQVAADGNRAGQTYPDQSLYPADSVPNMVKRINNALTRADQINQVDGSGGDTYWYAPIMADAEAGFGGPLNAFELMKAMIEAGAAGVHFEDQLAAEKKCGHLGGKVLVPTCNFIKVLSAARLAADVMGVPTILLARTDSQSANLLTSDIDPADRQFMTGERTPEGYYRVKGGTDAAIARSLSYAPYADMLWFETSTPDLGEAREFAHAIHEKFPGKLLAYNCSPSFNWKRNLDEKTIAKFQDELNSMGFRYQFITLAGWHNINYHAYAMATDYREECMSAYVRLQEKEFAREKEGYTATRHQHEVGTGYFDQVLMTLTGGESSTAALAGSTEAAQFAKDH